MNQNPAHAIEIVSTAFHEVQSYNRQSFAYHFDYYVYFIHCYVDPSAMRLSLSSSEVM